MPCIQWPAFRVISRVHRTLAMRATREFKLNFFNEKQGKETYAVGEQINFNNREDFTYGSSDIFLIRDFSHSRKLSC